MTQLKHLGGCQCGAVRFEVTLDIEKSVTCNCSRCQKVGSVLAFASGEQFKLLAGEDALTEFRFAQKKIQHLFCKTCGIQSFSRGTSTDGTPTVAVNVNCLDDVEPRKLTSHHYDGKSL